MQKNFASLYSKILNKIEALVSIIQSIELTVVETLKFSTIHENDFRISKMHST